MAWPPPVGRAGAGAAEWCNRWATRPDRVRGSCCRRRPRVRGASGRFCSSEMLWPVPVPVTISGTWAARRLGEPLAQLLIPAHRTGQDHVARTARPNLAVTAQDSTCPGQFVSLTKSGDSRCYIAGGDYLFVTTTLYFSCQCPYERPISQKTLIGPTSVSGCDRQAKFAIQLRQWQSSARPRRAVR